MFHGYLSSFPSQSQLEVRTEFGSVSMSRSVPAKTVQSQLALSLAATLECSLGLALEWLSSGDLGRDVIYVKQAVVLLPHELHLPALLDQILSQVGFLDTAYIDQLSHGSLHVSWICRMGIRVTFGQRQSLLRRIAELGHSLAYDLSFQFLPTLF